MYMIFLCIHEFNRFIKAHGVFLWLDIELHNHVLSIILWPNHSQFAHGELYFNPTKKPLIVCILTILTRCKA